MTFCGQKPQAAATVTPAVERSLRLVGAALCAEAIVMSPGLWLMSWS